MLVERFVEGTEVEVGVLGNLEPVASLPGEIVVTHNEWYDYEAKYDEGEMDLVVPARVTEAQIERAQELAVRAFVATDCEGMARADLFVRADGEVLVNELNTIPGFTSTSVYARLFEESGVPYAELLDRLADARSRTLRAARVTPLLMPSRLWNPWRLLRVPHPKLSDADESAFDALLARTPEGGIVEYDLAQPKWWFLHHHLGAGTSRTARTRPRSTSSGRGRTFDAHRRPDRRGLRVRRRDLAALLRSRQPAGRAELHQLVRARTSRRSAHSRYLFSIGSDPRDERSWTTGTIYLLPRATFDYTPASRELVSRQSRCVPVRDCRRRLTTSRSGARRAATGAATRCARCRSGTAPRALSSGSRALR